MAGQKEILIALNHLKQSLIDFHGNITTPSSPSKREVMNRIEHYVRLVLGAIERGDWPLELPIHGRPVDVLERVTMSWKTERQKRKCLLLFQLMGRVHSLLRTNTYSNKRDIYYEDVSIWGNQRVLDETVTQLTRLLNVPRRCLHIDATAKGLVAGPLTFLDADGKLVDCKTPNGLLIPSDVDELSQFRTTASLILVVEKDSTFQKLIDDNVEHFIGDCILLTGKGYPDVNTRRFLRRLWNELQLPPLALVDADPHGISIFTVYRYGSPNLEEMEHLAVPQLRLIGLQATDIRTLALPQEAKLMLTARDRTLINTLANRSYIVENELLHHQILELGRLDCKVEIQGLTKIHPQFLSRTYLPSKIATHSWI